MFPSFPDRREAGRQLAEALVSRRFENAVVLALPRGGVPVALEVARALHAPLDLLLVRKLGAPQQPELAIGAVVDGPEPQIVLNDGIVAELGVPPAFIEEEARRELAVIEKRRRIWIEGRVAHPVAGHTAIIVDDGIATGATVKAAILAVRRQGASRVVVATPVAPPDVVAALAGLADEVVAVATPTPFRAIGRFYDDFRQVEDTEVTEMLRRQGDPRRKETRDEI